VRRKYLLHERELFFLCAFLVVLCAIPSAFHVLPGRGGAPCKGDELCWADEDIAPPALPDEVTVQHDFDGGTIQGVASSQDALAQVVIADPPPGTLYSFTARETLQDASFTSAIPVDIYKKEDEGWTKVATVQSTEEGKSLLASIPPGDYAVVKAVVQSTETPLESKDMVVSRPVILPFIIGSIVIVAVGLVIIIMQGAFHSIDDVARAGPLPSILKEVKEYTPMSNVTARKHEAYLVLQTELIKGKSVDDAKVELLKQGFSPKTIEEVVKAAKK
jgi:hypothetical protein